MISTKLQGGLGNQMFQIAAAFALAKRNNDTFGFNFHDCFTPQQGNTSVKYIDNIFKNIPKTEGNVFHNHFLEPFFSYQKLEYKPNLFMTGSFQSEKYFEDYKNEVINLFDLSDIDIDEFKQTLDFDNNIFTSVHIRRGDYLNGYNLVFHSPCSKGYYLKAMSLFPNTKFIFFSDDINWVKENFVGEHIYYSSFNDELQDFKLMSECHNNIIANSTFSWWASYLNRNPNKTVVGPKKWFGPAGHQDTQDIIPNNWVTIDN
jgi:hypothetical protein